MEMWALLYLHDWGPDKKVYPQVHAIYADWRDAEKARAAMSDPTKYWVSRARVIP